MKIKIDGKEHEVSAEYLTVKYILNLGDKENELQNYALIRIFNDAEEDTLYNPIDKPKASLEDKIQLKENESFIIKALKTTLIVNSKNVLWDKKAISYEEVVKSAYGNYEYNPNIVYTISYFDDFSKTDGSLTKGEEVVIINGMVFNVSKTDKS